MQGTINVNVKDKESVEEVAVAVVDDTLSHLRLALGSSMCISQMVGSSLRVGRLNVMTSAQWIGSIVWIVMRIIGVMILARGLPTTM